MNTIIFFFVIGIILWIGSYFLFVFNKKEIISIKNVNEFSLKTIAKIIFVSTIITLCIILLFTGLLLTLSSLSMLIFELSTIMFNALSPNALEFKDCLNAIVQITSILGTAIIASLAYVFKKKT